MHLAKTPMQRLCLAHRGELQRRAAFFGTSARNLPLPRLKVRENLPLTSIAYDRTSPEVLKSYGHPRSCEEAARYGYPTLSCVELC
jgi:hypothetical protein